MVGAKSLYKALWAQLTHSDLRSENRAVRVPDRSGKPPRNVALGLPKLLVLTKEVGAELEV